jgi:hypothetical protein
LIVLYDFARDNTMDTIKHIHIGAGRLGLGYVLPLLQDDIDSRLMVRSAAGASDEHSDTERKNRFLLDNDEYEWQSSEVEATKVKRISCRQTYGYELKSGDTIVYPEGSEGPGWDDADIITTAVGIEKLPRIALWLGKILRQRMAQRDRKPVVLLAFENGSKPSTVLFDAILSTKAGFLKREEVAGRILVCDAVIDSICRVRPQKEKSSLVVIGQAKPSAFIMARNDYAEDIIRRTFRVDHSFGQTIIHRKSQSEELDRFIFDFNERKKAWLVNAPDYIVAANRIHNHSIRMPFETGDPSFLIVREFGNAAKQILENMLKAHGLNYETYLGAKSFLGICEERIDATISTIVNSARSAERQDDCFEVLRKLGVYHATSYIKNGVYSKENPFIACIHCIADFITTDESARRFMLDNPKFQEWCTEQGDDFQEWFDKKALASFKAELHSRLSDFYLRYDLSSYLNKIRDRLVLSGIKQEKPLCIEDIRRDATVYDGIDNRALSAILSAIDEQLSVASDELKKAAGTISMSAF